MPSAVTSRKPTTYLPSYKDVDANSPTYKSKVVKVPKFERLSLSSPEPPTPTRTKSGPLPPQKNTFPRKNPGQRIFGTIRTTVKPQHVGAQHPSRRKSHSTPKGHFRRPKLDESFSNTNPEQNPPEKAHLRYIDAEEEEEAVVEEEDHDAEGVTQTLESGQYEAQEEVSDLDDLTGYVVSSGEEEQEEKLTEQYSRSEESGELSEESEEPDVPDDATSDESDEEEFLRDYFKEEGKRTYGSESAELESPTGDGYHQPSNQDLTLPAHAGFVPSVAVPNTPVKPVAVSVSSLPRPEPELGPGGFPKLKQGCHSAGLQMFLFYFFHRVLNRNKF